MPLLHPDCLMKYLPQMFPRFVMDGGRKWLGGNIKIVMSVTSVPFVGVG